MNDTISETVQNGINEFSTVDYGVFGFMLCISAAIGVYFGFVDKNQSTEEYLLGGRKMKTLPIAISLVASQLSALSIMTLPAEIYSFGSQYLLIIPIVVLVTILINQVFLPVFYNNNIDNCYAYLEMRFSKSVRKIVTISFLVAAILILPIGSFIPALAFSHVSGQNIHVINGVVSAICVFYTMLGGIKAVVWTDVIQAAVMLVSIFSVLFISIVKVGGVSTVLERAIEGNRLQPFDMTFDLTTRQTFWNLSFGMFVMWGGYVGLNQSCVQRIVALPSINHAKRSLWLFCAGVMIILTLNCFSGVIMYSYYYDCDPIKAGHVEKPDKMVPYFVQEVVGQITGMPGLFISSVFSASLSTISANLNSLGGIIYSDYIRPRINHSDAKANFIMKTIIVIIGVYCVGMGFIVESFKSIFQVVNTIAGMTQGAVFGVFCLGMLFPRANHKAALIGTLISMLTLFWITAGSQILIAKNQFNYETLPTTVDGCEAKNITILLADSLLNTTSALPVPEESFSIYKISFPWYTVLGAVIVWIVAVPLSYIVGPQDSIDKLNPDLISPVARFLMPKRLLHMELPTAEAKEPLENGKSNEWVWKTDKNTLDLEKLDKSKE